MEHKKVVQIVLMQDINPFNGGQWSKDAVERREFAGKKAKLAAAELAKLSKRFSGELSLTIKFQS